VKAQKGVELHANVVDCSIQVCPLRLPGFFCGQTTGNDGLHVATLLVDQRVHECAGDSMLLAKFFAGDVVALEAKYHSKYLWFRKVRTSLSTIYLNLAGQLI